MKKMTDEELQQWLENNPPLTQSELTDEETRAYSALFEALNEEPDGGLPFDFAANVTRHVQAEAKRGSELKRYLMNAFWFLLASSAAVALIGLRSHDSTNLLLQNKWIIGFCIIGFCVIQGLDEKLTLSRLFKK